MVHSVRSRGQVPAARSARLLVALLAVGLSAATPALAAGGGRVGAKACTLGCATTAKTCTAAAKGERTAQLAACPTDRRLRRSCRTTARSIARATSRACGSFKRTCRACCKRGGEACERPEVTPDASRTASALLTPDGGTLTATGADGTAYTLAVPPNALLDDTTITLTPVTAIGGFRVGEGILGAVQAEPSGLLFLTPATLTVTPPAPGGERLAAFGWEDDSGDVHRELATTDGGGLRIFVRHFSGFGAGTESSPELRAIEALTPSNDALYWGGLILRIREERHRYLDVLRAWFGGVVEETLLAAVSDDAALRRGLREYDHWLFYVEEGPDILGLPFELASGLQDLRARAKTLIAAALRQAIARANASCLLRYSLADAERALGWQVIADMADVDTADHALDLDTVLDDLCVEVRYEDVTFPPVPPLDIPSVLRVRVGLVFRDGTPATGYLMEVRETPHGAHEGLAVGDTDATGTREFTFTPLGDRELRIDVRACANVAGRRRLRQVCQDAFVVRGLVLTPTSATLDEGGTQQFQTTLFGRPAPVTWSTTTGSIDDDGLLTAGTTPGSFEVRATNPVDGRLVTATVAVGRVTTTTVTSTTTTTLPAPSIAIVSRDSSVFAQAMVATACDPNVDSEQQRSTTLDPFAAAAGASLSCTAPNGLGGTYADEEWASASQGSSVTLDAAGRLVVTGTLTASASVNISCDPPHPSCPNLGSPGTGSGAGISVGFDVVGAAQAYSLSHSGDPAANCGFQLQHRTTFATTFLSHGQSGTLDPGPYWFTGSCGAGRPVSGSPETHTATLTFTVGG